MFAAAFYATQGTDNLPPAIEVIFIRIYSISKHSTYEIRKTNSSKTRTITACDTEFYVV